MGPPYMPIQLEGTTGTHPCASKVVFRISTVLLRISACGAAPLAYIQVTVQKTDRGAPEGAERLQAP